MFSDTNQPRTALNASGTTKATTVRPSGARKWAAAAREFNSMSLKSSGAMKKLSAALNRGARPVSLRIRRDKAHHASAVFHRTVGRNLFMFLWEEKAQINPNGQFGYAH